MEADGFRFQRREFSYLRKHGKDHEQIRFLFQNQFPLLYKISFFLKIWNNAIKKVKFSYLPYRKLDDYQLRTLIIFMGHFVEETDDSPRSGMIYDYSLVTQKDLFISVERIRGMLQDSALPLSHQLASTAGIDLFFADRPGWSVRTLSLSNITSELIAAKLNKQRDYQELARRIDHEVDEKIACGELAMDTKDFLQDFHVFLTNSY